MKRTRKILAGIVIALPLLIATVLVGLLWRQDSLDAALYQALLNLDVKATASLLNQGANPNATYAVPSPGAATARSSFWQKLWNRILHHKSGEHRIAALLVPVSYDIPVDSDIIRPYSPAVGAIIALLLQHGADSNVRDSGDLTPLFYAALYDDAPAVRLLLKHGARPNDRIPTIGSPFRFSGAPMTVAVAYQNTAMAKLLLDNGVDASGIEPNTGQSWLEEAVITENPDMVRLLLQYGAKVNRRYRGQTALEYTKPWSRQEPQCAAIIRLLQDAAGKEREGRR